MEEWEKLVFYSASGLERYYSISDELIFLSIPGALWKNILFYFGLVVIHLLNLLTIILLGSRFWSISGYFDKFNSSREVMSSGL